MSAVGAGSSGAKGATALKIVIGTLVAGAIVLLVSLALPVTPGTGLDGLRAMVVNLYFYGVLPLGSIAGLLLGGWATFPQARDNVGKGMLSVVLGGLALTGAFLSLVVDLPGMLIAG